jgi:hypothetical protein
LKITDQALHLEPGIARLEIDNGPDEWIARPLGAGVFGHWLDENSWRYLRRTNAWWNARSVERCKPMATFRIRFCLALPLERSWFCRQISPILFKRSPIAVDDGTRIGAGRIEFWRGTTFRSGEVEKA